MMIGSFVCRETEKIFHGHRSLVLAQDMQQVARRKLKYLHEARTLDDLRSPPGNRLEALKGGRKGQFSVRINDQWRICFEWMGGNAVQVEIIDYH
jgi:proteic killer suppression protein